MAATRLRSPAAPGCTRRINRIQGRRCSASRQRHGRAYSKVSYATLTVLTFNAARNSAVHSVAGFLILAKNYPSVPFHYFISIFQKHLQPSMVRLKSDTFNCHQWYFICSFIQAIAKLQKYKKWVFAKDNLKL